LYSITIFIRIYSKFVICDALIKILTPVPQASAQTGTAVNLPAGGKEGISMASKEDNDKADAKYEESQR
jgi:hypothetical protein